MNAEHDLKAYLDDHEYCLKWVEEELEKVKLERDELLECLCHCAKSFHSPELKRVMDKYGKKYG